jgi:hypothetical protein
MGAIDEGGGRWIASDSESGTARGQKQRFGICFGPFEPARVFAQLGTPVEIESSEKVGGGAF